MFSFFTFLQEILWSHRGVVDKASPYSSGVADVISSFTSLLYETLSHGSVSILPKLLVGRLTQTQRQQ